ncbi:MAG: CRISPR-associated endonuclease Cas2 [Clostridia bacterium]|nr:CRISPR-associated endonuclease Cas2 [Clostridia bacterium]
MIIISYDISDNKKRTKFAKYLSKFGYRLQYSVFQIENSERILNNIMSDIDNKFLKTFDQTDSVYIIKLNPNCEIVRYGYARNEESDMIIVT